MSEDKSAEREAVNIELIKLVFSVAGVIVSLWLLEHHGELEHWAWRWRTWRERRKVAEGQALRQVQREISLMEHGDGAA